MQDLHYPFTHEGRLPLKKIKPALLIVEDDLSFRETLALEFIERGYSVTLAASKKEVESISCEQIRFAIIDLRLGADNGLAILEHVHKLSPECRVVILTGYGSIATAVKAVKNGAANYLTKPVAVELLEKALWIDLPAEGESGLPETKSSLARHEREYIEYVLSQCEGNISRAASWLGVHRQSLQRKLRKYPPKH